MKNKNVRGIIALAVVTALSFGVIMGSKALAKDMGTGASNTAEEQVKEEIDTKGAEGIEKAVKTENGYMVTAKVKGYGGDIVMNVSFDAEKKKVTKVEVTEQKETEGLGAKVADAEFLSQFEGVEAPVFLPGMSLEKEEKVSDEELLKELKDGTYEAKADAPDNNGFTDVVTVTVKDGKIAEVNWEAVGADGSTKSVLSENGEYVMTEDGLTWKEQAEALAKAVVENQSLSFLNLDEQGKTDAVSGVSISIGGFTALAEKCLKEAAGTTQTLELKDGTYEAKAEAADNNGFIDQVTMTVADGKITEVNWEAVGEDGSKKSVLSENGEYVMTEDGLTWKEQAEALANALIENQSLDFLQVNEQGKTDAISGVSISVGGFISLAEKCMNEAAGVEEKEEVPANGTQVDAVSGATISSTAVVTGINTAFEFLQTVK
ncbi:MAG: FMN-binding protein [Bacillota bacterium]|nr:FMN-binding protein [Bacillota bacterium]